MQRLTLQDEVFWTTEGDKWFRRNRNSLVDPSRLDQDFVLQMLEQLPVRPQNVVEIGASNGYRLAEIQHRYGSRCLAIEPSEEAITDGRQAYPNVEFRRGLAHDLPINSDEAFDVVIVNFVFHWIDRALLMRSVAEVDRVVQEGGYLILGDFLPDFPTRVRYHHLQDQDMYTFKQDYAAIFTDSNIYSTLLYLTYDHEHTKLIPVTNSMIRCVLTCLQKTLDDRYVIAMPP